MKTNLLKKTAAILAALGLSWSAVTALAQNSPATVTTQPQLAYGVPQVLQLVQAKVGEDTIIAYVRNSGTSYGLNADQIIYLRQQGVSDAVITAMLNQPRAGVGVASSPAPATSYATPAPSSPESVSTATVAPTVTYVQTVPTTTYYYYDQPYYYPYYYGYGFYPPVTFSFGWGGGWHGGYHGGGFHGGGFHGGGHR